MLCITGRAQVEAAELGSDKGLGFHSIRLTMSHPNSNMPLPQEVPGMSHVLMLLMLLFSAQHAWHTWVCGRTTYPSACR